MTLLGPAFSSRTWRWPRADCRFPVMDEDTRAFVDGWLAANAALLSDIVASAGRDPRTVYGAAVLAVLAAYSPKGQPDLKPAWL